jgi:radical SAM-linked protein
MRVRLRFAKLGKLRWTSHRDVARMWERAFRRVRLPLAYTEGFSPRPRVSFGLALPTGHESVAEYLDLELRREPADAGAGNGQFEIDALPASLSAALPVGIDVLAAAVIDDRAPSLQEEVTSCTWRVEVGGPFERDGVAACVERALAAESLVITRQRKGQPVTDDVRPAILAVRLGGLGPTGLPVLECDLATQPRGLRPSELLLAVHPDLEEANVCRLHQWIERDGARREPLGLPVDATDAPRTELTQVVRAG